jgi:hypothetical protein
MGQMGPKPRTRRQAAAPGVGRITGTLFLVFLAFLVDGTWHSAPPWEYGLLDDFHFSVREELGGEREFQIDNYYAMDVYRIGGTLDFHSAFLVTNDLNLLDREAVQLTLAYLDVDRLLGRFNMRAGRQFFAEGFDPFIGDGVFAEVAAGPLFHVSARFAVPFDAESEAIDDEPMFVYGLGLKTTQWGKGSFAPFTLGAHVERRDRTDLDGLDQTLLGFDALAEVAIPIESDVYAALEYEAEDSRMRGIRFGSRLYVSPMLTCLLQAERYDPDTRDLKKQVTEFLSDTIVNYFSGSAVWRGDVALIYSLPKGREVKVSYSPQSYDRRNGDGIFGQGVDCFFTFLSVPSVSGSVGAGYAGRIVEERSIHLGVVRASATLAPQMQMTFLSESGILNTRSWEDEWVLHLRALLGYSPRPNLTISSGVEGNRNPYFRYDIRGMVFVRYFWAARVEK